MTLLGPPGWIHSIISSSVSAGYARWIFLIISLYFMPFNQFLGASFYILSGFLDAFDGWAARKFNQGLNKNYNDGLPYLTLI